MTSEHYPRIRIDTLFGQRRLLKIRESVSITFYMKRSHQEVVHPVMRALDVYRRAVGPRALGWYAEPYSEDWNELDDKGWASIQRHMLEEPAASPWLRESASETLGYEFTYDGLLLEVHDWDPASQVSFFLPTEYLEEHGPGRVRELALELAAELPFNSGHAGLCFHFRAAALARHPRVGALAVHEPPHRGRLLRGGHAPLAAPLPRLMREHRRPGAALEKRLPARFTCRRLQVKGYLCPHRGGQDSSRIKDLHSYRVYPPVHPWPTPLVDVYK
jgi:hypothetical protein